MLPAPHGRETEFAPGPRTVARPLRLVAPMPPLKAPRLLDQVRERIRYLHYIQRTEDAVCIGFAPL